MSVPKGQNWEPLQCFTWLSSLQGDECQDSLPLQSCLTENWPLNHFHPLAEKEAAAGGNRVRG